MLNSIGKALQWMFVIVFFGLLQMWWVVGTRYFGGDPAQWMDFVQRGVLLFFCSATIISGAFGVLLKKRQDGLSSWDIWWHVSVPFVVIVAICAIYSTMLDGKPVTDRMMYPQVALATYSVLYAVGTKLRRN